MVVEVVGVARRHPPDSTNRAPGITRAGRSGVIGPKIRGRGGVRWGPLQPIRQTHEAEPNIGGGRVGLELEFNLGK